MVTPSYNQASFLEQTIRSVLLQGYPDLEYIIMDGGSTDGSVDIIRKYEKWLTYWVSEPDKGQSHAINKGFEKATGDVYGWLNSDDFLMKDALGSVAGAYEASPDAGVWCGGCLRVRADGSSVWVRWPNRSDPEGIARWKENSFGQPACFFSRGAWDLCGPLDEELEYGMDFDLWLKLANKFALRKIDKVLAGEHAHGDAKTQRDIGQMYAVQYLLQIRHGHEAIAVEDMSEQINHYLETERKIGRIQSLPLVRFVLPMVRPFLRRL